LKDCKTQNLFQVNYTLSVTEDATYVVLKYFSANFQASVEKSRNFYWWKIHWKLAT